MRSDISKFGSPVDWASSPQPVAYLDALRIMEARAAAIRNTGAPELVWLVEHPPVYTAGTSAKPADLLAPDRFPVFQTGRGGQFTYHGPGQRIAYLMLDLRARGGDVKQFVCELERWIIRTLAEFGVKGAIKEGRVGVWVERPGREDKIAALGIRVRHGVTFHGISINVAPELEHFSGIVPCGIAGHGVTSFADLGVQASMAELDVVLQREFAAAFGQTCLVAPPQ